MANDLIEGLRGDALAYSGCADISGMVRRVSKAADTLEALQAENAALKEYAFEVSKALTGLTVGGSEFFKGSSRFGFYEADIPACLKNVQWRMEQQWKLAEARTRAALQQDKEGE